MTTVTNIEKKVIDPNTYPFRIGTIEIPKSVDELKKEASILASLSSLKEEHKIAGKEKTYEEYMQIAKDINEDKKSIDDLEKERIELFRKRIKTPVEKVVEETEDTEKTVKEVIEGDADTVAFLKKMGIDRIKGLKESLMVAVANDIAGEQLFTMAGAKSEKTNYILEKTGFLSS